MSKKKKPVPPCPGNPEDYIFVNTREGGHWQRRRGTVKVARLNTSFKNNVKLTKLISPVASQIKRKLMPYLEWMDTGRFVANVSGLLKKEYNRSGKLDFMGLAGYEVQPYYKLQKLFRRAYDVQVKKNEVIIEIFISEDAVKPGSKDMTGYFFEGILVYGDLTKPNSLRTDSDTSPIYEIRSKIKDTCRISLMLPSKKVSWMVLLKMTCTYGKIPAKNRIYLGMKVVWAERV
jgi:hypothetical protein